MKYPALPPNIDHILADVAPPERARALLRGAGIVDNDGRYQHWDDLRFKKPPADLTATEWWTAMRLARRAAAQSLPLNDAANHRFSFCEPPALKALLRELDMNAGGAPAAAAAGMSQGEGRLYLARSLAEEPFASSFIEGAATTRQIAKQLILEDRRPRTKDERMVLGNYRAMQFVKAHKDDPLTLAMLLELHRIVTDGTLDDDANAGRIRSRDDIRVIDAASNEVLHQPPPAADLPERLEALIDFANATPDAKNWVHPLLAATVLHFMLSYEHPFVDGNGRVARALFYWAALKAGYWLIEYVSISAAIAESLIQYGRAFLLCETDSGDLTYFLIYHTEALNKAINRLMDYAEKKRRDVADFEQRLAARDFNPRQAFLLNELARSRQDHATVATHAERHGVSYLTARHDLEALVETKYLRREKNGRTVVYRPVRDLLKVLTSG